MPLSAPSAVGIGPAALVTAAARPISEIVRGLDASDLAAPTPCAAYDIRALLNHLLFWGPGLTAAAHQQPAAPPVAAETDVDLVVGDWPVAFDTLVTDMVAAWSDPSAWVGMTSMGGSGGLPAAMVGGMAVGELVVHGWDLGRALGRSPEWDRELLAFLHPEVSAVAETGRQMGVFGPEVAVAETAPTLDRILGVTGRDPAWTP